MKLLDLEEEQEVIPVGHTLNLLRTKEGLLAYKGYEDFRGIDLYYIDEYSSASPWMMNKKGQLMTDRRWPVVAESDGKFYLFCTRAIENGAGMWRTQQILLYTSDTPFEFKNFSVLVPNASAPWIYREGDDWYFLYHEELEDGTHNLCVKKSKEIETLNVAEKKIIISVCNPTKDERLSAPSVIKLDDTYWLTGEYKNTETSWFTNLYSSKNILGPYNLEKENWLGDWRACAFQHIIDGQYVLTFSRRFSQMDWNCSLKWGKTNV